MAQNKDGLFPLFSSCFVNSSNATITEIYTLLFDKMVNLRKRDGTVLGDVRHTQER